MFGQNVNNDFYSTLNKTICKLTECEGHNSSRREARRVLRLFADRDKRYAHPVRINKAIIIITLHNELCFICFIPFHFHFVTIAESSLQVFLLFHAIYQGNWPINQKKNLTTFAAISTPYRQLLLCRSCFLLRLLSCITIITIIVALPTHMISSQLKRTCLSFN